MLPHDYVSVATMATCTTDGKTVYTCSICGNSYEDAIMQATGHAYIKKTVAPTSKEKGYDLYKCSRCGDSYKDNYTDPVVTWTEVNETVYAKSDVNIRKGSGTSFEKVDVLKMGESVKRIAKGNNGWSRVEYNGEVVYISSNYLSTKKPEPNTSAGYPKIYSDSTAKITITKEWYKKAWCYIAHLEFTDYDRFGTACAKNKWVSYETTSCAAKRLGAIFAVNGPYTNKDVSSFEVVRHGKVYNDKGISFSVYNSHNGILADARKLGIRGKLASEAVAANEMTDSLNFWRTLLVLDGVNQVKENDDSRAQRTFIGTNGKPGDIWIVVSEGRKKDGESAGLTSYEEAQLMLKLGCTYAIGLDGGGSSTMYFNGKVLNSAAGQERAVVDFVYFK